MNENIEIELGDVVKCIHTGFTGKALSMTKFYNGCVQYEVVPKITKDNKMPESIMIDSQSLEVVKKKSQPKKKKSSEATGGPMHKSIKMRGY